MIVPKISHHHSGLFKLTNHHHPTQPLLHSQLLIRFSKKMFDISIFLNPANQVEVLFSEVLYWTDSQTLNHHLHHTPQYQGLSR